MFSEDEMIVDHSVILPVVLAAATGNAETFTTPPTAVPPPNPYFSYVVMRAA